MAETKAQTNSSSIEDPFRYGWRFVERRLPSGKIVSEQVPLTEEHQ